MHNKVFVLGMVCMASVSFLRVCAAAPDRELSLQDEVFFLQNEVKRLQAELADKDNALKKLLLDAQAARDERTAMVKENEALETKVDAQRRMLISCDAQAQRSAEQAAIPFRARIDELNGEIKVMAMTLEQKNDHILRLTGENRGGRERAEKLEAEKISLLTSLKKLSAEYDAFKVSVEGRESDAQAELGRKVKDLQVRLAAEQTLVEEKIAQARKPLETRIAEMEDACRQREVRAAQQEKRGKSLLEEKVRKLEQQILLLKENAASEIKALKDRLSAVSPAPARK